MDDYQTRKQKDREKEEIVHHWLEQHLWDKFPNYKSNSNRERQVLGVDCEFTGKDNFQYICDEKAATSEMYINPGHVVSIDKNGREVTAKKLNTFCLELSMRTKPNKYSPWKRYEGWLLREEEINNSYCFVWVDRTKSNTILSVDDILEAQVTVVKKDRIMEFLKSKGWDKDKLRRQVEIVLKNPEYFYKAKPIGGLLFSYPERLKNEEAPVNVLLFRDDYEKLSCFNKKYNLD